MSPPLWCQWYLDGGQPEGGFTRADGTHCLLYTVNGEQQGFSYGQAGLVTFDGQNFTWEWPVEGDVREAEEFGMGTLEEVAHLLQPSRSEEFYSLLLDYYQDL